MKSKEEILTILEKRNKDAFSNGFQNYEKRQLELAIIAIRDYVPPECFPSTPVVGREQLIEFAQQFYSDKETCIHNVDQYLASHPVSIATDERFKMPSDKQLIDIAILFNDGKIQERKLADMIGMCEFVLDRLYENNDVLIKSSKED